MHAYMCARVFQAIFTHWGPAKSRENASFQLSEQSYSAFSFLRRWRSMCVYNCKNRGAYASNTTMRNAW